MIFNKASAVSVGKLICNNALHIYSMWWFINNFLFRHKMYITHLISAKTYSPSMHSTFAQRKYNFQAQNSSGCKSLRAIECDNLIGNPCQVLCWNSSEKWRIKYTPICMSISKLFHWVQYRYCMNKCIKAHSPNQIHYTFMQCGNMLVLPLWWD